METSSASHPEVDGLEQHLGYWLRRVSNAVSGAFSHALHAKETSVAEWVVLHALQSRGFATPGELATAAGLTRGAVSKIVDKLEEKAWVHNEVSEADSRSRVLSLTKAGRRNFPLLKKIADTNDAFFFDCLSGAEQDQLRELLTKIAEHHRMHDVPTE